MVISSELQERYNAQKNFRIGEMQREKVREGRREGGGVARKGGKDTEPKGKVGVPSGLCTFDFVGGSIKYHGFTMIAK